MNIKNKIFNLFLNFHKTKLIHRQIATLIALIKILQIFDLQLFDNQLNLYLLFREVIYHLKSIFENTAKKPFLPKVYSTKRTEPHIIAFIHLHSSTISKEYFIKRLLGWLGHVLQPSHSRYLLKLMTECVKSAKVLSRTGLIQLREIRNAQATQREKGFKDRKSSGASMHRIRSLGSVSNPSRQQSEPNRWRQWRLRRRIIRGFKNNEGKGYGLGKE